VYKKNNFLKWVLAYLTVAILVYLGIYYFAISKQKQTYSTIYSVPTKSPEGNENWKTFKNDKVGYSIKYPPEWKLRKEDESGQLYMLSNSANIIEIQNDTTYNLKPGQTAENYLDNIPVVRSQPTKKIAIGNYTAYLQRGIPGNGELGEATYLHIKHKDKYLNVAIIKGKYENVSSIFQTIKFVD